MRSKPPGIMVKGFDSLLAMRPYGKRIRPFGCGAGRPGCFFPLVAVA